MHSPTPKKKFVPKNFVYLPQKTIFHASLKEPITWHIYLTHPPHQKKKILPKKFIILTSLPSPPPHPNPPIKKLMLKDGLRLVILLLSIFL